MGSKKMLTEGKIKQTKKYIKRDWLLENKV